MDYRRVRSGRLFVHDDIAATADTSVSLALVRRDDVVSVGRGTGVPPLVGDEHEVTAFEVWFHARALDGDHGWPDTGDREENGTNSGDHCNRFGDVFGVQTRG